MTCPLGGCPDLGLNLNLNNTICCVCGQGNASNEGGGGGVGGAQAGGNNDSSSGEGTQGGPQKRTRIQGPLSKQQKETITSQPRSSQGTGSVGEIEEGEGGTESLFGPLGKRLPPSVSQAASDAYVLAQDVHGCLQGTMCQKGLVFCYDACAPRCEAPCGKPENGCGCCGRFFCELLATCCITDTTQLSKNQILSFIRDLEEGYGTVTVLLAQQKSGINFTDIVKAGRGLTPSQEREIIAACEECYSRVPEYLQNGKQDRMRDLQKTCFSILEGSGFNSLLEVFSSDIDEPSCSDVTMIIGSDGSSSKADWVRLCESMSLLQVERMFDGRVVQGTLGLREATRVVMSVNNVLSKEGKCRRIWISEDELMALCCFIIFLRGSLVLGSDGKTCEAGDWSDQQQMTQFNRNVKRSCEKQHGNWKNHGVFGSGDSADQLDGASSSTSSSIFSRNPQARNQHPSDHQHQSKYISTKVGSELLSGVMVFSSESMDEVDGPISSTGASGCPVCCCFGSSCCCACCGEGGGGSRRSSVTPGPRGFNLGGSNDGGNNGDQQMSTQF